MVGRYVVITSLKHGGQVCSKELKELLLKEVVDEFCNHEMDGEELPSQSYDQPDALIWSVAVPLGQLPPRDVEEWQVNRNPKRIRAGTQPHVHSVGYPHYCLHVPASYLRLYIKLLEFG